MKKGHVKCGKCSSKNVSSVEYPFDHPEHYDGTSEWRCLDCGARFGRWSGKELKEGEVERRYGLPEDAGFALFFLVIMTSVLYLVCHYPS